MSTPTKPEYKAELSPVPADGLTIEPTVLRSWTVKDSHHPVLEATVEGNLLAIEMGGHSIRISTVQASAVRMVIDAWKRTWNE